MIFPYSYIVWIYKHTIWKSAPDTEYEKKKIDRGRIRFWEYSITLLQPELLFSTKTQKEIKEKQNKMKTVMSTWCHPAAMPFWQEWKMLCYLKLLYWNWCILYALLMENWWLVKLKFSKKNLNFFIETTPTPLSEILIVWSHLATVTYFSCWLVLN